MKLSITLALLASSILATEGLAQNGLVSARPPQLKLASLDSAGVQGNSWSGWAALSGNGRFVAFHSYSDNLVPGDTNVNYDVFVHDRATGITERVSVDSLGGQASGSCVYPAISDDGRMVAFIGYATNLVPGDVNGMQDVFVHDRVSGATTLVSKSTAGVQANGNCELPSISADGRFVAFQSFATTLAPDPNGTRRDAFVHDRATGTTKLVSVGHAGQAADENCDATTISGDGSSVAFSTSAGNLVPGDTNNGSDVFVRNLVAGTTVRASLNWNGTQSDGYSTSPSLSFDGSLVAFHTSGALVPGDLDGGFFDVYVRDLAAGVTNAVTSMDPGFVSNTAITRPAISSDGTRVAFESVVVNYPFFETRHVHVRDMPSGVTKLVSQRFGQPGDGDSTGAEISPDGRIVGFETMAANLIFPDANGVAGDVLVHVEPRK